MRLRGWDYTSDGAYFVTVCSQHRVCLFGEICGVTMQINDLGLVVAETWQWLTSQYAYVALDKWCVMPNHLHGLLIITGRGGSRAAPTTGGIGAAAGEHVERGKPIGQLIGAFKTVSTKRVNTLRGTRGEMLWQRNYWEHIVRDDAEMDDLRAYIRNNPAQWAIDSLNVEP